jgi:hypothetical protein
MPVRGRTAVFSFLAFAFGLCLAIIFHHRNVGFQHPLLRADQSSGFIAAEYADGKAPSMPPFESMGAFRSLLELTIFAQI